MSKCKKCMGMGSYYASYGDQMDYKLTRCDCSKPSEMTTLRTELSQAKADVIEHKRELKELTSKWLRSEKKSNADNKRLRRLVMEAYDEGWKCSNPPGEYLWEHSDVRKALEETK